VQLGPKRRHGVTPLSRLDLRVTILFGSIEDSPHLITRLRFKGDAYARQPALVSDRDGADFLIAHPDMTYVPRLRAMVVGRGGSPLNATRPTSRSASAETSRRERPGFSRPVSGSTGASIRSRHAVARHAGKARHRLPRQHPLCPVCAEYGSNRVTTMRQMMRLLRNNSELHAGRLDDQAEIVALREGGEIGVCLGLIAHGGVIE
jgi:hypothetical protein